MQKAFRYCSIIVVANNVKQWDGLFCFSETKKTVPAFQHEGLTSRPKNYYNFV